MFKLPLSNYTQLIPLPAAVNYTENTSRLFHRIILLYNTIFHCSNATQYSQPLLTRDMVVTDAAATERQLKRLLQQSHCTISTNIYTDPSAVTQTPSPSLQYCHCMMVTDRPTNRRLYKLRIDNSLRRCYAQGAHSETRFGTTFCK